MTATPGDEPAGDAVDLVLDEDHPHEAVRSQAQLDALRALLAPGPRRVLELGCGRGRVLEALVDAGHAVTAVERREAALEHCRSRLEGRQPPVELIAGDFMRDQLPIGPFDAVCCLGNTLMTIVEPQEAVALFERIRRRLGGDGVLVIDDIPAAFWPEVVEGNWQQGISEDGRLQMVWHPTDAVFVLRRDDEVDPDDWTIRPGERRFRLWTDAALHLTARAAGLSGPRRIEAGGLLILRPSAP